MACLNITQQQCQHDGHMNTVGCKFGFYTTTIVTSWKDMFRYYTTILMHNDNSDTLERHV